MKRPGLWQACPLCGGWMDHTTEGYECPPCLGAARAGGWNPEGQADLFAAPGRVMA